MFAYQLVGSLATCLTAFLAAASLLQAEPADRLDFYGDPLPPGAVSRLGAARLRTHGGLIAATYSADGEQVVGISRDAICYWSAADGRLAARSPLDGEAYRSAFSRDRRRCCILAVNGGDAYGDLNGVFTAWDIQRREVLATAPVDWRLVVSLAMTADGSFFAAGTQEGRVRIFETASGAELLSYPLSEQPVMSLAFSPDGEWLVLGHAIGKRQRWNWTQGVEPVQFSDSRGATFAIDFSPDGEFVALAPGRLGCVDVRRVADWSDVALLRADQGQNRVMSVSFSPDGCRIAAFDASEQAVLVWDVASGAQQLSLSTDPQRTGAVCFSPDGRWLVFASGDFAGPPRIWDAQSGKPKTLGDGHQMPPAWIDFLPTDDKWAEFVPAAQTVVTSSDDGTIRYWDAVTGEPLRMSSHRLKDGARNLLQQAGLRTNLASSTDPFDTSIRAMAVSEDGRFIATSTKESIRLWGASNGFALHRFPGYGGASSPHALAFAPDGSRLFLWADGKHLYAWDAESGEWDVHGRIGPIATSRGTGSARIRLRSSSSPNLVLGQNPSMVYGPSDWTMRFSHATFSPDARHFLVAYPSGGYVYDVPTRERVGRYQVEEGPIGTPVAASPDGQCFATVLGSDAVVLNGLPGGDMLRRIELPGSPASALAFSRDGSLLAVGVGKVGGPIGIHDVDTGRQVSEIAGFESAPVALAFSRDDRLLASSMSDTTVLVWDLSVNGRQNRESKEPATE